MTPREIVRAEAARLRAGIDPASALARDWERASPERRDALDDALIFRAHRIAGPTLAGYPSPAVGAAYTLGAGLAELAPELTRREAATWLRQTEHEQPVAWLAAQVAARHGVNVAASTAVPVLRWLDAALGDPARRAALERTRTARMGEVEVEGRLLDRVDALTPADLAESVTDTFAAAAQRIARERWTGPDELAPHEAWHDRLPPGVTVLRTATDLWAEGTECRHSVGAYAARVHARECVIVRVVAPDGTRSTVEVVRGRVAQHRGPANREPSEACLRLVAACRWS